MDKQSAPILTLKNAFYMLILSIFCGIAADLILSRCAPIIIDFFKAISSSLTDYIYKSASHGLSEQPSMMTLVFLNTMIASAGILLCANVFFKMRSIYSDAKRLNAIYSKLSDDDTQGRSSDIEEIENPNSNLKQQAEQIYMTVRKKYHLTLVLLFPLCSFSLLCLSLVVITDISHTIAVNTLHNIDIVAPYVADHDYKLLLSDFYQMESESDYNTLIRRISSIATENGLTLKK